jgi:hypothetical protein
MVPPGNQLNCPAPSDIDRRAPASEALSIVPFWHNTVLPEASDIFPGTQTRASTSAANYIGVILMTMCEFPTAARNSAHVIWRISSRIAIPVRAAGMG